MNLPEIPVLLVYVARRALAPFGALAAILLFALTLERVLSLVQLVTELGAPPYVVGELVGYLLPHYLGLAIPAAWFLAVLIAFRGLQRDSELAVMRASGLPLRQLLVPILIVSLVLGLVMAALTGYLQPYSRHAYRARLQDLRRQDFWSKLQPRVFTPIEGARNVIRAGAVEENGRRLKDFFASYERPGPRRAFVTAREAVIQAPADADDTDTQVTLLDGMIVLRDDRPGARRPLQTLTFQSFPWTLSETGLLPPYGPRGQDEREMIFGELRSGRAAVVPANDSSARRLTEWHSRLVECVSVPMLAVLAVPLALLGRGRTGKAYGFVIGIVLLVLYQKLLSSGEAYGKMGSLPPALSVWLPFITFVLLALAAFHYLGGDRDASTTRAMRQRDVASTS